MASSGLHCMELAMGFAMGFGMGFGIFMSGGGSGAGTSPVPGVASICMEFSFRLG